MIATYKKISKSVNISEPTIAKVFKKLQNNNFIEKIQNGVYAVNPEIMMKGNDRKQAILIRYHDDLLDNK